MNGEQQARGEIPNTKNLLKTIIGKSTTVEIS